MELISSGANFFCVKYGFPAKFNSISIFQKIWRDVSWSKNLIKSYSCLRWKFVSLRNIYFVCLLIITSVFICIKIIHRKHKTKLLSWVLGSLSLAGLFGLPDNIHSDSHLLTINIMAQYHYNVYKFQGILLNSASAIKHR